MRTALFGLLQQSRNKTTTERREAMFDDDTGIEAFADLPGPRSGLSGYVQVTLTGVPLSGLA